ncbi:tRNA (N6-threonylcarbamoyladenosine(37)-N6)-methyltransferase TrmO [uncultured Methanocorpusculum sp.]|nr:tRNA (N6-threonylcarbamoyladenosine(37)-N6)-methyltransferase TrmO [uncultured Methanocorpusculum sp.]
MMQKTDQNNSRNSEEKTVIQSSEDIPDSFTYTPIGIVHSPYTDTAGMPIQPTGAEGVRGTIILRPELSPGLKDLQEFSHIILIYAFHRSCGYSLQVTPFLDTVQHGVFATRAPKRPNAIGLSTVRLIDIRDNVLTIENVDLLDGTPLLDIKPYVPAFDVFSSAKAGWLDKTSQEAESARSDKRFSI